MKKQKGPEGMVERVGEMRKGSRERIEKGSREGIKKDRA